MTTSTTIEAVFIPAVGSEQDLARAAYLASLADSSATGVLIARLALRRAGVVDVPQSPDLVYPSMESPICGINLKDRKIRKGPIGLIDKWVSSTGGFCHCRLRSVVSQITNRGGYAIVIATETVVLGVVYLKTIQAA